MSGITLSQASTIIDEVLAHARGAELRPLAVVVIDAGAHLVAAKREDGASLFRIDIAIGKATGALGMGYGTREIAARASTAPGFFGAVAAKEGRLVPAPGGILILNAEGIVIGAVGVSGDMGDADEAAGIAGIAAAGLLAQPGA